MTIPALRDYQQDSIDQLMEIWTEKGYKAPVLHLATGLGKSAIVCNLVKQNIDLNKKRVLVVVDKIQLVNQMWRNFKHWFPESEDTYTIHSRPGLGRVMNVHNEVLSRIVVATPQTLAGTDEETQEPDMSRLDEILNFGPIDLVVYDEAHSIVNPRGLAVQRHLLRANPDMWTLGPTATPRRHDGVSLRAIFDCTGPSYSLRWGIENGYLCPIGDTMQFYAEMIGTEKKHKIGKFSNAFELMNDAWKEHSKGRKTAWYHDSVADSRSFCEFMQSLGHTIAHIDSELCIDFDGQIRTDAYAREAILKAFAEEPDKTHITNYEVLSTGWDCPPLSCIALGRSTENITWLTQVIGRGTRVHPSKKDLVILDFATKQLELFMEDNDLLDGYSLRERSAKVEDDEEIEEEVDELLDPDNLEEDEIITGRGMIVKIVDLLDSFGGTWYRDHNGTYSLQLNSDMALVIVSPDHDRADKLEELANMLPDMQEEFRPLIKLRRSYSLWVIRGEKKDRNGREFIRYQTDDRPAFVSPYLDLVLDMARPYKAKYGDPKMFQPGRRWRKEPPTPGQIAYCRRLGYGGPIESKGEASQIITHYKIVPSVVDKIRFLMEVANKSYQMLKERVS